MKTLRYEGVGYNAEWVARQTMEDFVKHRLNHDFKNKPLDERKAMLASVYRKCCGLCGIKPKAPEKTDEKPSKSSKREEEPTANKA